MPTGPIGSTRGAAVPARLISVDALRGIACLWVVLYHVGAYWQGAVYRGWDVLSTDVDGLVPRALVLASRTGFQGVSLFLVLSGFCLHYPVVRRGTLELGRFAEARAFRIVPPYYASIALLWVASTTSVGRWAVFYPIEPWDVAVHALFVHNLVPRSIWSIDGAYWSLALEAQLYLVFPLLVAAARRVGMGAVYAGALGLAVVWPFAMAAVAPTATGGLWGVLNTGLPARLSELCAGMLAARLVADGVPRWGRWVLVALSIAWLPATWLVHVSKVVALPLDAAVCGASFAAILTLAVGREGARPGPVVRALARVGDVSYSLYLIHQPLLLATRPALYARGWPAWLVWLVALTLAIPLLVLAAQGFHRLFEAPFLAGGFFRAKRTRGAPAPVSGT